MRRLVVESDFVCRIAGEPTSRLQALGSTALDQLLGEYITCCRSDEGLRESASDLLYTLVSRATAEARHTLIRIRRAIHNGREIPDRDWAIGTREMEPHQLTLLETAVSHTRRRRQLEVQIRNVHESEWDRVTDEIWTQVRSGDVCSGLCLSSDALAEHVVGEHRQESAGARKGQIERGLLRYLTRAAAKPTPFSTFCTLVAGRIEPSRDTVSNARIVGDVSKTSAIRLNRAIFPALWNELIQIEPFRDSMPVCAAPSLRKLDGRFEFVCEDAGIEITRKVTSNRALDSLIDMLITHGPTPFRTLADHLAAGTSAEDGSATATAYVLRLVEIGMIQYWHGIAPLDPDWDTRLMGLLVVEDPTIRSTREKLSVLREHVSTYANLPAAERFTLIQRTKQEVTALFDIFDKKVRMPNNLPFYEDCGASATGEVRVHVTSSFVDTLERLQTLLRSLSTQWDEQATLRAVYHRCYGHTAAAIPLLQFFEDSFREFYKRQFAIERGQRADEDKDYNLFNPLGLPSISERADRRTRLVTLLRRWVEDAPAAQEADIPIADLQQVFILDQPDPFDVSASAFGQIFEGPDCIQQFVLPEAKVLLGYGKYFSRFLHVLPQVFTESVRELNARYESVFTEISDESDFNANLHPSLFDSEIVYPTKAAASSLLKRFDCNDLFVVPSQEFEGLVLRVGADGATLIPLDLGFLNPMLRPALHRLLQKFQPACTAWLPVEQAIHSLTYQRWTRFHQDEPSSPLPIVQTPRVTIEGRIVVARRRWRIPPQQFPSTQAGEPRDEYFLRLQQWRDSYGIPPRVFAKVLPCLLSVASSSEGRPSPAKTLNKVRDNRKPQYIDFTSPRLVDLFSRLRTDGQHLDVVVEEALPDLQHAWKHDADSFLTEVVLQLSTVGNAAPSIVALPEVEGELVHA